MEVNHPSQSPVSRLPGEIIVRLLHLCSYQTILRFAQTCRRYRDLVVSTASLELHIELDVSGLQVVSGTLNAERGHSTMLNDLRAYRTAWQNLNLEPEFQKVQHNVEDTVYWDIYNDVLFKCTQSNAIHPLGSVVFAPLDTASCSIPIQAETFITLAVDLTQELIVLVTFNTDTFSSSFGGHIHLVSSVTGGPHPNADMPTFGIRGLTPIDMDFILGAQIPYTALMGEMLLISSGNRAGLHKIFAWNWKTGDLYRTLSDEGHLCGISWLDQSHFSALIGIGDHGHGVQKLCLRVYVTDSTLDHQPSLETCDCSIATSHILQLDFPVLCENISISVDYLGTTLLTQPDCTPGRPIQVGSTTFSYPRIPTLGIRLILQTAQSSRFQCFYIFACVDSLLQLVQSQNRAVSWSEWGVTSTRWFVDEFNIQNTSPDRYSRMRMSTSRYARVFCDSETREDSKGEGGEGGGGNETGVDRGDEEAEDGLLCVADFKHTHWRIGLNKGLNREDQDLIRCGHWPFSPQNHNVLADATSKATPSSPKNFPRQSEEIRAVVVGSDTPTVLGEKEGFNEPVESSLPYRLVARRRPVPRGIPWMMGHDRIIGLQVASPNVTAIVYRLRQLNED